MARILLGSMITDIRGSIGNHTFGNWKGIAYIRSKADHVTNPQTEFQQRLRRFFTESVRIWNMDLSREQKARWEEYAQSQRQPNSRDEVVGAGGIIPERGRIMSGFNAFIALNQILIGADMARVADPPTFPPPAGPWLKNIRWDETAGEIIAGWELPAMTEGPGPGGVPLSRKLEWWVKAQLQGAHAHIIAPEPVPPEASSGEKNIRGIRVGGAGAVSLVDIATLCPVDIYIQACVVRSDGERSAPSRLELVHCTVPTPP